MRTVEDIRLTMDTSRYSMSTFLSMEYRVRKMIEDIQILLDEIDSLNNAHKGA